MLVAFLAYKDQFSQRVGTLLDTMNPMENVWAYLRANKLCARVWDSYDDILRACQSAWLFLTNGPDRIRSIGARAWATVNA